MAAGELVGTPESTILILPKNFSKRFDFGFVEVVPIERAVVTFTSGELYDRQLTQYPEGGVGFMFKSSWDDLFDRDKVGGRDFSDIARIEFIKKEDYEGDLQIHMLFSGDSDNFARLGDVPGVWFSITLHAPKNATRFVAIELSESIADNDLFRHLNDNALYYSQAVWRSLDAATIALLLSPYMVWDRPVIELIDPLPIMVAGNYLVFRMYTDADDTEWTKFLEKHKLASGTVYEDIVPLPSGGVFAEAVLGRANAALRDNMRVPEYLRLFTKLADHAGTAL